MTPSIRTTGADHWSSPRRQDPSQRLMTHGPVKPAEEAGSLFHFICRAVMVLVTAAVVAFAVLQ